MEAGVQHWAASNLIFWWKPCAVPCIVEHGKEGTKEIIVFTKNKTKLFSGLSITNSVSKKKKVNSPLHEKHGSDHGSSTLVTQTCPDTDCFMDTKPEHEFWWRLINWGLSMNDLWNRRPEAAEQRKWRLRVPTPEVMDYWLSISLSGVGYLTRSCGLENAGHCHPSWLPTRTVQ